jgi:hypothetical protein
VAQRIGLVTGVDPGSLLRGENPLRALDGSIFTKDTRPPKGSADQEAIDQAVFILKAAIASSKEARYDDGSRDRDHDSLKFDHSSQFIIKFQEWIAHTMAEMRAEEPFWKMLFGSWKDYQPEEGSVQRFRPKHAFKRREKPDKGKRRKRDETYRELWDIRRLMIQRTKAKIFCEAQPPGTAAKLLERLGTAHDVSGDGELMLFSFPNDPLEAKKFLGELEKAWIRFAKSRGLLDAQEIRKLTNAERYTLDRVVLFQAALERLAQARAPLVLPAAAAVLSKEKRKNRS